MEKKVCKIIFSIIFLGLAALIAILPWAKENIDNKVIFLIMFSLIPWLNIKTLEILGFGKVELVPKEAKEKTEKVIREIENETKKGNPNKSKSLNLNSVSTINLLRDPLFKLVMIRVELERHLNKIAENHNIEKQYPNRNLAQLLSNDGIISKNDYELIKLLWPILNKAAHSDTQKVDFSEIEWAITTGLFLLERIETISNKN